MRRGIERSRINELSVLVVSTIEHVADEGGILLAIFIHSDDPVATA